MSAAAARVGAKVETVVPPVLALGNYLVGERLGEGGMGEVYRATDTMLEREVALKALRPEMSARADVVERFRVEAIALARLHHRHIAAVYSFFQDHDRHYIAMQYVRGRTLEAVLQQRGALPWREATAVAIDVLEALDHAHALGVVHRDLKPANLMIDHEGRTVVMDFGIARMAERGRQTRAGTLVGTLEYIAPEIVRGGDADARSDLYALGCVLYEMVSGALPFESASDFALMRAHAEQQPSRPIVRNGDMPAALETIILRALEKQPGKRYANAQAMREALTAVLGTAPRSLAPALRAQAFGDVVTTTLGGAARRFGMHARTHTGAAWRWLELPREGGWPAWKMWLRANLGLASVVGVVIGAAVLALAMGTRQLCCSAPVVPLTSQHDAHHLQPDTPPSQGGGAVQVKLPLEMSAGITPAVDAPTPPPAAHPSEPVEVPPPLVRSVRVAPGVPVDPPATSGPTAQADAAPVAPSASLPTRSLAPRASSRAPSSPGWYVKR